MRISSEQRISNKPWEPAALEDALCLQVHTKVIVKKQNTPRGQPLAKRELRQGKFQQHIKHQHNTIVDEPHDLDTPSISIVSCPYEVF